MIQADDRLNESIYRGVKIEKRYSHSEFCYGHEIKVYSWIARGDRWVVVAPSLGALHAAIDQNLDVLV